MTDEMKRLFINPVDININGVIKADDQTDLAGELDEYVVTNEVNNCLSDLFNYYNELKPTYNGVWISGFFGCGKSHLLKILSYLIENSNVGGKRCIDYFEDKLVEDRMLFGQMQKAASIPSESILFNIVQLNSNSFKQPILQIFLRKFYEHCGYHGQNAKIAAMERELDLENLLIPFIEKVEELTGNSWDEVCKKPNIKKKYIIQAFAEVTGQPQDMNLLDRYKEEPSIEDFAGLVKEYMDSKGPNFRLNFFIDEVGQFVASSARLMVDLQEIVSALASQTGNKSWVFVTSQDQLDRFVEGLDKASKNDVSKIQGRFYVKMKLSNRNVNEIIQKRLLLKTERGKSITGSTFNIQKDNFDTLFQFVNGPKKYRNYSDMDEFSVTYPFVTYQFDMFKETFESLSEHNAFPGDYTSTGARSMLDVFHSVLVDLCNRDDVVAGQALVPYYAMYDGIENILKENFKHSVYSAEANITDDSFSINVLKTLLLVKYLQKQFKPTAHNLSVLMRTSFDEKAGDLLKKTQESLDRLERETYIQRNGETYDFLTNEEKDVEEEIKNIALRNEDVKDELNSIIYKRILSGLNKASDERKIMNYSFIKNLDFEFVSGPHNSELSLNILTPFGGQGDYLTVSSALNAPDTELVVILSPNRRLVEDLNLYKKTEQFLKMNSSSECTQERRQVIETNRLRNDDRKKDIEVTLREMLEKADIFISGNPTGITEGAPDKRISKAFELLIDKIYVNLRMIVDRMKSEQEIKSILSNNEEITDIYETEAEKVVRNQLNLDKNRVVSTISSLLNIFGSKPYGWPDNALLYNLVVLLKRGKINIKLDGRIIDNLADLRNRIFSTQLYDHISIELAETVDPNKIKKLKNFILDFCNYREVSEEPKRIANTAKEKLVEEFNKISGLISNNRFKFSDSIKENLKLLEQYLDHDYIYYYTSDFLEAIDDILDLKDDCLDRYEQFVGNRIGMDTFRNATKLINECVAYKSELGEEYSKVVAIIDDPLIYTKSVISVLPNAVVVLKEKLSQIFTERRDMLLHKISLESEAVLNKPEYLNSDAEGKEQISEVFHELENKAYSAVTISDVLNIMGFDLERANISIKNIASMHKASCVEGEGKKHIRLSDILNESKTVKIETADDVEKYVQSLKELLLDKIEEDYVID